MTHKEKILQFVETTGLNKTKFCKVCGLSNGYLDSKGAITTDKLKKILENFRSLNVNWLLFNEGNMQLSEDFQGLNVPNEVYKTKELDINNQLLTIERKLDYLLVFNKIDVESVNALMHLRKKNNTEN